nr:hypothetical protein [Pseudomonas sp. BIGb0427]
MTQSCAWSLNGMGAEPLQQIRQRDTCPDGIRLAFNQMEIQVFIRQSLQGVAAEQRGNSLYALTRRLYRLEALDNAAREQAGSRDEAEVRLAYRLQWARELDLPVPPSNMLYRTAANIRPGELDAALSQVRQGEGGQAFLDFARGGTSGGLPAREPRRSFHGAQVCLRGRGTGAVRPLSG